MRWYARIFVATLISIGIAMLLSYLPNLDLFNQNAKGHVAVFGNYKQVQLNDENMVDRLTKLPLHLDIVKVNWDHSIFTVDLIAGETELKPKQIYEDLYQLSHFGLTGTTNVKQVLIRVMAPDETDFKSRHLLLAVDARRENVSIETDRLLKLNKISYEQYVKSQFHLSYTKQWKEKDGPVT